MNTKKRFFLFSGAVTVLFNVLFSMSACALGNKNTAMEDNPPRLANNTAIHTWWQQNASASATGTVASNAVRTSPFYGVTVGETQKNQYDSFVYMTIPRGGHQKIGYTSEDGAEFAAKAGLTTSWSSFEYSKSVWVIVSLKNSKVNITATSQVTIRPQIPKFKKALVPNNPHAIAIQVPYSESGYRFSVEFNSQLINIYNDTSQGVSGALTTADTSPSDQLIQTEPHNALLIFANPMGKTPVPDTHKNNVYYPTPGLISPQFDKVNNSVIYFKPGIYYMGNQYAAHLSSAVKWIYLAPGAYVKGAFKFREKQPTINITGLGVLSGEQYVYQADASNHYRHAPGSCCGTCLRELQLFVTKNETLNIQGITLNNIPYNSFVAYGNKGSENDLTMAVDNYKQVGSWYWQTDGVELFGRSDHLGTLTNSFIGSNDDSIKLYHSNTRVKNIVVWHGENGPVIQFGWYPRNLSNIDVDGIDILHNLMGWSDVKENTCIINSAVYTLSDLANPNDHIDNMTFSNIRSEGGINCLMRIYALSRISNVNINHVYIDHWNDLSYQSDQSLIQTMFDKSGHPVPIGASGQAGIFIRDYEVNGTVISLPNENWQSFQLGRLNIPGSLWGKWALLPS